MRFTISRERLLEALSAVLPAIPIKAPFPVLSHCLVETTADGVRFTSASFESRITADVTADVMTAGKATIPAAKLKEIAAKLTSAPVSFDVKGERTAIHCESARFTLAGFATSDFLVAPDVNFAEAWKVNAADVRALVERTAFATSTDPGRMVLQGVLWELRAKDMRMVATDGTMLVKMDRAASGGKTERKLIVTPWALEQVARLFPDNEEIELANAENHLAFRSPSRTLYTRLIEGPYPIYDMVIPKDGDRIALVGKAAFTGALERVVAITPKDWHNVVRLSFEPAAVRLSAKTNELGDALDECAIAYTGDPLQINLNAKCLLELLRHLPGDDIKLAMKTASTAVTIEPMSSKEPGAYLSLLMPVRDRG